MKNSIVLLSVLTFGNFAFGKSVESEFERGVRERNNARDIEMTIERHQFPPPLTPGQKIVPPQNRNSEVAGCPECPKPSRLEHKNKKLYVPKAKASTQTVDTELYVPKAKASNIKIFDENNIDVIPHNDFWGESKYRISEGKEFNRNWKNKQLTFRGQINRGKGISLGSVYINGCEDVTRHMKLGTTVTVTATLVDFDTGGSGGEPMMVTACSVATSATTSEFTLGHLTGGSKNDVGAGCVYYFTSDKKRENLIGVDAPTAAVGIVLNINGTNVNVSGTYDNNSNFTGKFNQYLIKIPAGKSRSCGEECIVAQTFIAITSDGNTKKIPITSLCGS